MQEFTRKINKGINYKILSLILFFFAPGSLPQSLESRIDKIISQMTLQEKILQLHQEGTFNTADNLRLGIPGFYMADGPHGVRDGNATAYPVGIAMAATWDTELMFRVGISMGKEFRGKGKNQALGPCMDLTRDPRNGRTPESVGEDPFLCASITASLIKGMQLTGTIATAKHFNGDSQQEGRFTNNYMASQRTLLEHLGSNYRMAVQDAGVLSVMNAYNLINGAKCAENHNLLTAILRNTWGFPYYVVSDWASIWSSKNAINAGCNICMGSDNYKNDLLNLVNSGQVSINTINDAVKKVLRTKILSGMMDYYPDGNPNDVNSNESKAIALETARKSIVLLKNSNNILPLNKSIINKIAVIGPSANVAQLDGTGSSGVTPFYSISPRQGLINKLGTTKVVYAKGCDINSAGTTGFAEALNIAATADFVIYVGGLDNTQEGEALDRVGGSINLPGKQRDLINQLAAVNPNLIVVLKSGGICGIANSINNIKALIQSFYPGQEGGNAIADVIFGDYNPGGKLPVTYPMTDAQLPSRNFDFDDDFGCGYRWFDQQNIVPLYPFGYGLSYTTFSYSNILVNPSNPQAGQKIIVTFNVTNTGLREGDEVVQLYLSDTHSSFFMPKKQLKRFERVHLNPGQSKQVTFELNAEDFYYFDEDANAYKVSPGSYTLKAGGSSDNLPLVKTFNMEPASLKPDLKIAWIKTMPAYPVKGDTVTFFAAVKNQGTGSSPDLTDYKIQFKVNNQLVSTSVDFKASIVTGGMAFITASGTGTSSWIPSSAGVNTIQAIIDPDNSISECNEDNNITETTVTVYNKPQVNIAKNKSVTVSSVEGTGLEGAKAVDGSKASRWASQFSDPQWIQIDLGQIKHIKRVDLYWEAAYGKDYSIYTSNNATDWNLNSYITNSDGGLDRIYFTADARYIKLNGLRRATQYGYSLYEFEVYEDSIQTDVKNETSEINNYYISQNYPNPFNPSTVIEFGLKEQQFIKVQVFNSLGETVKTLAEGEYNHGKYQLTWNGDDNYGKKVSAGVYIYRISGSAFVQSRKMLLIK